MRGFLIILVVVLAGIGIGVGVEAASPTSSALPRALQAAINRTTRVASIEISVTSGNTDGGYVAIYNAPDRFEQLSRGIHIISVGSATYVNLGNFGGGQPVYQRESISQFPAIVPVRGHSAEYEEAFQTFSSLDGTTINGSGPRFKIERWEITHGRGPYTSQVLGGEIDLSYGYVARIKVRLLETMTFSGRVRRQGETLVFTYSHFGSAPRIVAPKRTISCPKSAGVLAKSGTFGCSDGFYGSGVAVGAG